MKISGVGAASSGYFQNFDRTRSDMAWPSLHQTYNVNMFLANMQQGYHIPGGPNKDIKFLNLHI